MAQALGKGVCVEQRIFAFAQVGIIEVEGQREHVDSECVGERGFHEGELGFFVDRLFPDRLFSD